MDENFLRSRLQRMTKNELISEIKHVRNQRLFVKVTTASLEQMSVPELHNLILNTPGYIWDNNIQADWNHVGEARVFDFMMGKAREMHQNRINSLMQFDRANLLYFLNMAHNIHFVPLAYRNNLSDLTRDELLAIAIKHPEFSQDGQSRSINPDFWIPKPHQIEHYQNLTEGLLHPLNHSRMVLNGSDPGKGKTIATIMNLLDLKCRNILIICPGSVVAKWDDAMRPYSPIFEYRIATYNGIKGTERNKPVRWSKYKDDPQNQKHSEDNDWMQVRDTGKTGLRDAFYDWSFLPGKTPGGGGSGGCVVVWDEIQNAKGKSKVNACFTDMVKYFAELSSGNLNPAVYHGDLSLDKFVRSICLTGSMLENITDMPYLMYALGYIQLPTPKSMKMFNEEMLGRKFRQTVGEDWRPWYDEITSMDNKLLVFFRTVGRRKKIFGQIPDILDYVLYKIGAIEDPYPENRNQFIDQVLTQRFRELMAEDYRNDMNTYGSKQMLMAYLAHVNKDPRYKDLGIQTILDNDWHNHVSFQALQIQDAEIAQFTRLNREITQMLQDAEAGLIDRRSVLGQMQKAFTQLEVFKLAPFTELARYALNTTLSNGARPSVVISMNRNFSLRHFAWRLEAVLEVEELAANKTSSEELTKMQYDMVEQIIKRQDSYVLEEEARRRELKPLAIMSMFERYSRDDLMNMTFEQLLTQHNKWIKYLNVDSFKHVCVYVGDFGVSRAAKDVNLESLDPMDRIRDSKPLTNIQKEEAKNLFQANQRRVFLTGMSIGRLGIDLHDISEGGMHPRIMLMSPGYIANYFIQMKQRIARQGQTSESFVLAGYVDNVHGVPSWEARLMNRMSNKVNQIQLVHQGEIAFDIEENIQKEEGGLLSMLFEDLDEMENEEADAEGQDITKVQQMLKDALEGKLGSKDDKSNIDTTSKYLAKVSIAKSAKATVKGLNVVKKNLVLMSSDTYVAVIFDKNADADTIAKMRNYIKDILEEMRIDPSYYMFGDKIYNSMISPGVLIYKPAMLVRGILVPDLIQQIESLTDSSVLAQNSQDSDYAHLNFTPPLTIPRFLMIFESIESIVIGPSYPSVMYLRQDLINSAGLRMSKFDERSVKIEGNPDGVMAVYYSMILVYKYILPGIYRELMILDNTGVRRANMGDRTINYKMVDGQMYIEAGSGLFSLLMLILSTKQDLQLPISRSEIFDMSTYKDQNGKGSIRVMPDYVSFTKEFLDEANK